MQFVHIGKINDIADVNLSNGVFISFNLLVNLTINIFLLIK